MIDATRGPVLIGREAVVQAFSRVEGPCYLGPGTQVLAARLRGGSFGPQCRLGGEVESSVVQGFSNKYHDGFLGHSYVGEWVNFGAGSHTSDLRTDYGPIKMTVNGAAVQSGVIKIGSYLGDHTTRRSRFCSLSRSTRDRSAAVCSYSPRYSSSCAGVHSWPRRAITVAAVANISRRSVRSCTRPCP